VKLLGTAQQTINDWTTALEAFQYDWSGDFREMSECLRTVGSDRKRLHVLEDRWFSVVFMIALMNILSTCENTWSYGETINIDWISPQVNMMWIQVSKFLLVCHPIDTAIKKQFQSRLFISILSAFLLFNEWTEEDIYAYDLIKIPNVSLIAIDPLECRSLFAIEHSKFLLRSCFFNEFIEAMESMRAKYGE
jgi:hypothetical protein